MNREFGVVRGQSEMPDIEFRSRWKFLRRAKHWLLERLSPTYRNRDLGPHRYEFTGRFIAERVDDADHLKRIAEERDAGTDPEIE